jgi:hypothetical protein
MIEGDREPAPTRNQAGSCENGSGARQHDIVRADEVDRARQRAATNEPRDPRVGLGIADGDQT